MVIIEGLVVIVALIIFTLASMAGLIFLLLSIKIISDNASHNDRVGILLLTMACLLTALVSYAWLSLPFIKPG